MTKNSIAPVLFLLIAARPLRAQEIPLAQYVRENLKQSRNRKR